VFRTEEFDADFAKLDGSDQQRVRKIRDQLREQGDSVGKPLGGVRLFREKRFKGKRLYFLVYEKPRVVLLLGIGDKKAQQATINQILADLAHYQQYVFNRLKKERLG